MAHQLHIRNGSGLVSSLWPHSQGTYQSAPLHLAPIYFCCITLSLDPQDLPRQKHQPHGIGLLLSLVELINFVEENIKKFLSFESHLEDSLNFWYHVILNLTLICTLIKYYIKPYKPI